MAMIREVSRERKHWRVLLDNGECIRITGSQLRERPLEAGDELDIEEYDQWLLLRQYRAALDRAVSYLAARDHSRGEIEQKLLRIGYRPVTVEMVLYKLQTIGVLNDASFARQWTDARVRRGYGERRIAQELRRKGLDEAIVRDTLNEVNEDVRDENALVLARKALSRAKPGEDARKSASRAIAALARRGFDYETSVRAVRQAQAEQKTTDDFEWDD